MGYSISHEKYEKLEKNRCDGRLCGAGDRGGCANRATVREFSDFWVRIEDKAAGLPPYRTAADDKGMTLCRRHSLGLGYEGRNFTVKRVERY